MIKNQSDTEPEFSMTDEQWEKKRIRLRKMFPHLSEDDFRFEEGKDEEMINRLYKKLRKSKEALKKFIEAI